jgi:thiol:disulfide interchange protein DsbD
MLGVAIWMLGRILPAPVTLLLWAGLAMLCAAYLFHDLGLRLPRAKPLRIAASVLMGTYALMLLAGAMAGATDPLRPLAPFVRHADGAPAHASLPFVRIKTVAELESALAAARQADKPVMFDFYADWCVSCITMERTVFSRTSVRDALADTVLLQADVTANDAADRELLKFLGVYGPPTIIFFGRDGRERQIYRIVGEMNADEFLAHLARVRGS